MMSLNRKFACGEAPPHVLAAPQGVGSAPPLLPDPGAVHRHHPPFATRHPHIPFAPAQAMSLLTPTESRVFQSFLDATAFPADWTMQLEISHEHMPPARGREALTKATRDLMSLDGNDWRFPPGPCSPEASPATSAERQHPPPLALLRSARRQRSLDDNAHEAGLANPLPTHPGSSPPSARPHGQPAAPLVFDHAMGGVPAAGAGRVRADPRAYDHSSSSSSSRQSPADLLTSPARRPPSAKRSPPPDAKPSSKRYRPAASSSSSQNLVDEALLLPPQSRAALLSPSQKKANHIQSEQKRRANIRRGYDALCDTVPALREACQAEEEQQLAEGKSKGSGRRRAKGKERSDDGDKIDGRAGPRSENVVLSKTIDYLHELLSERDGLMQRLQVARCALPADHPLLQPRPDAALPLWERRWSGGEGGNDDDDDDDADDDD